MKTENYIMLKADEGKVLTNGEIYGKTILLGNGDSADNYREITEEEYNSVISEKEKIEN